MRGVEGRSHWSFLLKTGNCYYPGGVLTLQNTLLFPAHVASAGVAAHQLPMTLAVTVNAVDQSLDV